jgi:prepilin-type processing-associated H-X9-DG protein/prepilin-type N-terminal cleavage/methylation domain-containing protein
MPEAKAWSAPRLTACLHTARWRWRLAPRVHDRLPSVPFACDLCPWPCLRAVRESARTQTGGCPLPSPAIFIGLPGEEFEDDSRERKMKRISKPKDAFTLIELLIVIGIMVLLAAMLLPGLAQGQASAKSAACRSNLRQIGIALISYVDCEDYFPPVNQDDPGLLEIYAWPAHLLPHLGSNTVVFRCPAARPETEWSRAPNGPQPFPFNLTAYSRFAYGYNAFGAGAGGWLGLGNAGEFRLPASRVLVPSEMIAIGDSNGDNVADAEIEFRKPPGLALPLAPPGKRHRSGANIVFCDGHVEWAGQRKWLDRTDEAARRWNNDNQSHPEVWRANRF